MKVRPEDAFADQPVAAICTKIKIFSKF
jgi:hypothetical protein